jgi:NlpC/P60 family putative phage cell wall peptidase
MSQANDFPVRIVALARGWIGTPYRHQASCRGIGCDCLGLVRGVWRELYGDEPEAVPAYSAGWAETPARTGEPLAAAARRHLQEIDTRSLAPGDVVLFRWRSHLPAKHVGITVSDTCMVHAQEGAAVCEVALTSWWRRHQAYAFRFPPNR